jgi:chemotaxis protein methyltransferase CheR
MSRALEALPIDIARIEQILERACGVALSAGLQRALKGSFHRAAEASGLGSEEFGAQLDRGEPDAVASLVEHSVVGETYFFRHPEHHEALTRWLRSEQAPKGPLRIWSAGCATGEEPYSLAMALLLSGRSADRVEGTDVSERALRIAEAGRYGPWSMRRLPKDIRARFFEPQGNGHQLVREVRARVGFRRHNLVTEAGPADAFDVIVCRNVLIYFAPKTAARVLHLLERALKPGGLLVLGPVELPLASLLALEWIDLGDATLLRKAESGTPVCRRRGPPRPLAARGQAPRRSEARPADPQPSKRDPPPALMQEGLFERAREAARRGQLEEAEQLARECAAAELLPEAYLLLSMAAEARDELGAAVDAVRRALYLEPSLAAGHASLVALFTRMGNRGAAERARRNALQALEGLEDSALVRGVEAITAGALRRALERAQGGRVAS